MNSDSSCLFITFVKGIYPNGGQGEHGGQGGQCEHGGQGEHLHQTTLLENIYLKLILQYTANSSGIFNNFLF